MKRKDGYYIKNINPYQKLMPHIMKQRCDAMNWATVDIRCESIDAFIKEQADQGNHYTYLHVIIASIVRLFARRPCLNRFVMNGRIYQHHDITVAMAVKKKLRDDVEDTTVKMHFSGAESLDEVKSIVDDVINSNIGNDVYNRVDKTAKMLTSTPNFLIRWMWNFLGFLDKLNLLPASLIETSPFHNSVFVTFLKSIKGDALFHHCYNFGTTGIFFGVGKEKDMPVVDNGQLAVGRVMQVGTVLDERFCDGLYFVNSLRLWKTLLRRPTMLMEGYDLDSEDHLINGVLTPEQKKHKKELARRQRQAKRVNKD